MSYLQIILPQLKNNSSCLFGLNKLSFRRRNLLQALHIWRKLSSRKRFLTRTSFEMTKIGGF
jgi:hypothetical protein